MPGNPTWNTFLNANANYAWQDGDVYLIPQTDTSEGAGPGASFSGLGSDNVPHQELLNKVNYLKRQQVQATSQVGPSGWYKFLDQDQNVGLISPIIQWGSIVQTGPITSTGGAPGGGAHGGTGSPTLNGTFNINFPIAFTTTVWQVTVSFSLAPISAFRIPFTAPDPFGGEDGFWQVLWPPSLTQAQLFLIGEDWDTFYGTFWWSASGY